MNKEFRRRYIWRRARDLAWSGKYKDAAAIAAALVAEGYHEAPLVLAGTAIRDRLNRICVETRTTKSLG